jgi:mRNA (guanine-N7-)-methyltransferase
MSDSVSRHYDKHTNDSRNMDRNKSPIAGLRRVNNWIKKLLIQTYTSNRSKVLDVCSGKFGDGFKYSGFASHVTFADFSSNAIEEAKRRYTESKLAYDARFVVADCRLPSTDLFANASYDAVFCQFALHYACSDEKNMRGILSNIGQSLKSGGYFVATFPDAKELKRTTSRFDSSCFGNKLCTFEFDDDKPDWESKFGLRYKFSLEDAVVSCPEYVVNTKTLTDLAAETGMEMVKLQNFADFIYDNKRCPTDGVRDEEWEIIYMYMIAVFRKK